MNWRIPILTVLSALLFVVAGCESIGDRLKSRFTPEPPRVRQFTGDYDQIFEVTKLVLSEMGFRSIRGRAGSKKLTGVSRVNVNDAMSGASQVTVKILFVETMPDETELQVWMTEVVEDEFSQSGGYGTQRPLQGELLYNLLFRGMEQVLGED